MPGLFTGSFTGVLPRLLLGACLTLGASTAHAQTFTNPHPITIADAVGATPGQATPMPSAITVPAGLGNGGTLRHLAVRLHGPVHPRLADLDILLVPPAASGFAPVMLLSDIGAGLDGHDRTLTFTDESLTKANSVAEVILSVPYAATDDGGGADNVPGVGTATFGSDLKSLRGMNPAGEWRLYVVDDMQGVTGAIGEGWSLSLVVGNDTTVVGPVNIQSPASAGLVREAQDSPLVQSKANLQGRLSGIRVELTGLTHPRPQDLEIMLRSPAGTCVPLISDGAGKDAIAVVNIGFEDNDDFYPPITTNVGSKLTSGTYRPTNYPGGAGDADLAPSCTKTKLSLADLLGETPNGDWRLYVGDDTPANDGVLAGWILTLSTSRRPPIVEVTTPAYGAISGWAPTITIAGTVTAVDAPVDAIRWRHAISDHFDQNVPDRYEEGAWQPLAAGATTWSLTNVPLPIGRGAVFVDLRDAAGNVVSRELESDHALRRYSLAEGATGAFFDLDIVLFNPHARAVPTEVRFITGSGAVVTRQYTLAPRQRVKLDVNEIPGLEEATVSTEVLPSLPLPIAAERLMTWGASKYGGHAGQAVENSPVWMFAEGAQGFYQTYLLLVNPNETEVTALVWFLREGETRVERSETIPPHSRVTIDASTMPELHARAFGIMVQASAPIAAERSMYFGGAQGRLWEGGHESSGVMWPSEVSILTEGATGDFFETFVLIANPGTKDADVVVIYLLESGEIIQTVKAVPAMGRLSINPEWEDPRLKSAAFSTLVAGSEPLVVERAMYWPGGPATWTEAHANTALTEVGAAWAVADGRVGGPDGFSTYLLLANPQLEQAAEADVLFIRDTGEQVTRHITIPPLSRLTVDAGAELAAWNGPDGVSFSAVVSTTNGSPMTLERSTYWNAEGRVWSGGVSVHGTPFFPVP